MSSSWAAGNITSKTTASDLVLLSDNFDSKNLSSQLPVLKKVGYVSKRQILKMALSCFSWDKNCFTKRTRPTGNNFGAYCKS